MARVAGLAYAGLRVAAMVSVKRRTIYAVEQRASHLHRRASVSLHYACGEGDERGKKYNIIPILHNQMKVSHAHVHIIRS